MSLTDAGSAVEAQMKLRLLGRRGVGPAEDQEDLAAFEESKAQHALGFSPLAVCVFVLANTVLGGSGMLGIPQAFSVAGSHLGLFLICVFGTMSAFGCHLLQCTARRIGEAPCTFYSVAARVCPRWSWLIDGAVAVKCLGVGTSYLIIVGDLLPQAMAAWGARGVLASRWFCILIGFCVGAPLACLSNLSSLKYTSFCTLSIVLWTMVLVVVFFCGGMDPCDNGVDQLPCDGAKTLDIGDAGPVQFLKAFPVFIFGFTCQQNVFTVCNEVRQASKRRVDTIILVSYLIAGCAFAVTAFLAYSTYGDLLSHDVLQSYPQSIIVQVTRSLFACVAVFSYPLQVHPSRLSFLALLRLACGPRNLDDTSPEFRRIEARRYYVVTVFLLATSVTIALSVNSLGIVLGIVGATGSTLVSYILPGLMYFMAFQTFHVKRIFAMCQFGLGCIIMPTCLAALFM